VLALYLLAFNLIVLAVDFPFTYYSGYALELGQWFGEFMKGEAIGFVVGLLLLWLLYLAIRRSPRRWWLWTGAFTGPIAAFLIVIAPIVIAPMFNKFSPLSDEALKPA
jgi:STE24 endopeptidase